MVISKHTKANNNTNGTHIIGHTTHNAVIAKAKANTQIVIKSQIIIFISLKVNNIKFWLVFIFW